MSELARLLESGRKALMGGRVAEAEPIFRQLLQTQPNHADALHLLGFAQYQLGRAAEAVPLIARAISLAPNVASYLSNLGVVYQSLKQIDDAISCYKRALKLDPAIPEIHNNLASAYLSKGLFDQAFSSLRKALELRPGFTDALRNLANAYRDTGEHKQAMAVYRLLLRQHPQNHEARFSFSWLLLLLGQFEEGLQLWEARWSLPRLGSRPHVRGRLRWDGASPVGKTIYVYCEQGAGDAIQFCRYLPMLAQRGATIIFGTLPPLIELMSGFPGVAEILPQDATPPAFDLHCPITSLPLLMNTTLETIPQNVPYIFADRQRCEKWRQKIPPDNRKRVGLVWAGNPEHANDHNRSIALKHFAPLARVPNVQFFSLQIGEPSGQQRPFGLEMLDYTSELKSFADTAALIEQLDLVISVDTSVAHLAGAMGKPVWVLLPTPPDWRWMLDRTDSPWYPTMRLFRQARWGQWTQVLNDAATALEQWSVGGES
jgi:Tfp pilus assembly protein PilF/ADP-heptose:LPS heptosyltransferase